MRSMKDPSNQLRPASTMSYEDLPGLKTLMTGDEKHELASRVHARRSLGPV